MSGVLIEGLCVILFWLLVGLLVTYIWLHFISFNPTDRNFINLDTPPQDLILTPEESPKDSRHYKKNFRIKSFFKQAKNLIRHETMEYDSENSNEVLSLYSEALKIAKKSNDKHGIGRNLDNIGDVLRVMGYLNNALKYYEDALKIYREIGNRQGEANNLRNIGLVYKDKGELDTALTYLKQALGILETHNLTYGKNTIVNAIAQIEEF